MTERLDDRVRRLLGPAAPEVTCEQCFEQLDRYVESELRDGPVAAETTVPGMAAHLDGCPACAEEHATLRALLGDAPGAG
ncbi:MAG TPA: hypothetical protein VFU94_13250 [Conexibacter sp.]|nr:hypothetical protein [Conexibacter sp.]